MRGAPCASGRHQIVRARVVTAGTQHACRPNAPIHMNAMSMGPSLLTCQVMRRTRYHALSFSLQVTSGALAQGAGSTSNKSALQLGRLPISLANHLGKQCSSCSPSL